jgi:glycosyltransferase involved in cell wall biosynthesis
MRILIISAFFPPTNAIGALRVGKFARFLTSCGHDVRVVSAVQDGIPATLETTIPPEHVHALRWFDINTLAVRCFSRKVNAYRQGGARSSSIFTWAAEMWRALLNIPDNHLSWYFPARRAAEEIIQNWRPDLIFASASPVTALIVAHRLSQRHGIPWVAELRDLWTDNHYYTFPLWRRKLDELLERRVLCSAALLVTVSQPLADLVGGKLGKPTLVVTNGFDQADFPVDAKPPRDSRLTIRHMGMIYPGRRDPRPLFEALKQLGPLAERVRVQFHGRIQPGIGQMIEEMDVGRYVELLPAVSHAESLRLQKESDILLLLLWDVPAERGVFTGKLFEYIGSRRPVLCLGLEHGVAPDLIRERGVGSVATTPEAIAAQLRAWIEIKDRLGEIPSTPADHLVGLSRDEQYAKLECRLSELVADPPITVTHVITSLGSGGAESVLARLSTTPGPVRHAVVSLMDEGIHGEALRARGVSVSTLNIAPGSLALVLPWLRLVRHLRRTRPDIVMTWLYHADLMGSAASLLAGIRTIVWNVRCSNMDLTRYSRKTALVVRMLAVMSALPKVIVSNSAAGKRHHMELGYRPGVWQVIPNGFEIPSEPVPDRIQQAVRAELGGGDQTVVVGMVARVDAMKNHAGFLAAAAQAAAKEPQLRFVLIGRGTDDPTFEVVNTVSQLGLGTRTRLLGERQDVHRLLHGIDILVSASTFGEGLSNAVGEAMSMGIPCVVTDVGDSALLVGETGLVVPPGDTAALAEAILRMARMPADQRQTMGNAARSRIQESYSMLKMAGDYTALFSRLAKGLGSDTDTQAAPNRNHKCR